ncbi:MAG TPA: hypothetical protein ENN56_04220, partial [Firmicutes bacterium]|nr:hypothetical protein [Bacillota bacterium]
MHNGMRRDFAYTVFLILVAGFMGTSLMPDSVSADPDGDFAFAEHLMRDEMYDLAAQQLQLFVNNHPEHPKTADAFLLLASAYTERNEYARA